MQVVLQNRQGLTYNLQTEGDYRPAYVDCFVPFFEGRYFYTKDNSEEAIYTIREETSGD